MTPGIFHKISAHPMAVTWVIGACAMNGAVAASNTALVSAMAADWQGILYLLLGFISLSGFGFFLGMFTCWPLIRVLCGKFNGAPLKIGDKVFILFGPRKGTVAEVYEIITGQGGWELARLDLGQESKERYKDIFEQYSVLKIKHDESKLIVNDNLQT